MSLFPAYSSEGSKPDQDEDKEEERIEDDGVVNLEPPPIQIDLKEGVEDESTTEKEEIPAWLQNASYKSKEKEVVHLDSSDSPSSSAAGDSDVEITVVKEKTSNSSGKKRKKHRKKKDKKKKSRRRSPSALDHPRKPKSSTKSNDQIPSTSTTCQTSTGKWMFLDKEILLSNLPTQPFVLDQKRDLENLQYTEFYKHHVARYRYVPSKAYLFTDAKRHGNLWPTIYGKDGVVNEKKKKSKRYYQRRRRILPSSDPSSSAASTIIRLPCSKLRTSPIDYTSDVVELGSAEMVDENGQVLVYDAELDMYRPADDLKTSNQIEINDDELSATERSKRMNKKLQETPKNVQLWIDFINIQDAVNAEQAAGHQSTMTAAAARRRDLIGSSLLRTEDPTSVSSSTTDKSLLERKMAIVDRALGANPASFPLKLLRIRIGADGGLWSGGSSGGGSVAAGDGRDRIRAEWARLEFDGLNQPEMWQAQIDWTAGYFRSFKVTKQLELFDRCLSKLTTVLEGTITTHQPLPRTEDYLLEVLLQKAQFLAESGYYEKGLATLQACIEFNFFMPSQLCAANAQQITPAMIHGFFETFWNSGLPRIGEPGAIGWNGMDRSVRKMDCRSGDERLSKEEDELIKRGDVTEASVWIDVECLREFRQTLPFRTGGETEEAEEDVVEDYERLVIFDDVKPSLIPLVSSGNRRRLLSGFLQFLGAKLISTCNQSRNLHSREDDPGVQSLNRFVTATNNNNNFFRSDFPWISAQFEYLPELSWVDRAGNQEMIGRVFSAIIGGNNGDGNDGCPKMMTSLTDGQQLRTFFACCQLYHEARTIWSTEDLSPTLKRSRLKEAARELLSKNEWSRNCLLLYVVYVQELMAFGAVKDALETAKLALQISAGNSSLLDQFESGRGPAVRDAFMLIHFLCLASLKLQPKRSQAAFDEALSALISFFKLGWMKAGSKQKSSSNANSSAIDIAAARKRAMDLFTGQILLPSKDSNDAASNEPNVVLMELFTTSPSELYWSPSSVCLLSGLVIWLNFMLSVKNRSSASIGGGGLQLPWITLMNQIRSKLADLQPLAVGGSSSQIDVDMNWLAELRLELIRLFARLNPLAPGKLLRDELEALIPRHPGNISILRRYALDSAHGLQMVRMKQMLMLQQQESDSQGKEFSHCSSALNHQQAVCIGLERILARVEAEMKRYVWLTEINSSEKSTDIYGLRGAINYFLDLYPSYAILWRLLFKFEVLRGDFDAARLVFYRGVRACPWCKDLYLDFAKIDGDNSLQMVLDLMTEKEIRVRLPIEELRMLRKAYGFKKPSSSSATGMNGLASSSSSSDENHAEFSDD